jgi:hypothetical protein
MEWTMPSLRFDTHAPPKTPPRGIDVETTLEHFVVITYFVSLDALRAHLHPRFEPLRVEHSDGQDRALISVVPFLDRDFRFACCPWPRWRFGQTNYRAYVRDCETDELVVWFFGTSLASWSVYVPRYAWKLPWHPARMHFDCRLDPETGCYSRYRMTTRSRWAPANLELADDGQAVRHLPGFPDLETGLYVLTHPMRGYFYRRDGRLGSYHIWHDRLQPTTGRLERASFPLLERLKLVRDAALTAVHSVLIQPRIDFTIYLPPAAC